MLSPFRRAMLVLGAVAGLVSCSDSPTEPLMPTSTILIILNAVERDGSVVEVVLNGGAGTITHVACLDIAACPSTPRTSRSVNRYQIDILASRFIEAGIRDAYRSGIFRDGAYQLTFGLCTGCEHPVSYRVAYLDLSQWIELSGDLQNFPDGFRDAVDELVEFALTR